MPRKLRLAAAAALAFSLAGCGPALPQFRTGAPVEVEKKTLRRRFKQDGQDVDLRSLLAGLEAVDAAREDARIARRWFVTATAATAVAAAVVGYGAVTGFDGDGGWAIAGAGAGAGALMVVAGHRGERRLERAVRSYNGALASPTALVVPWAGTIRGSHDRCVAAGVAVRF
jgi:hypothetical protein